MELKSKLNLTKIKVIIKDNQLTTTEKIIHFLKNSQYQYSYFDLSKIAENANQLRTENSAYYTDEELLTLIEKELPDIKKDTIRILEPSVGVGNFLPILFRKYRSSKLIIDVVDIDKDSLEILKTLLELYKVPNNVKINYYGHDFCDWKINKHYDLAVGNPPFSKIKKTYFERIDLKYFQNLKSTNLASYFYEKCLYCSDVVCMVMPKNILNTPEFCDTRKYLQTKDVQAIVDFGEKGFKGVLVETICIKTSNVTKGDYTDVYSLTKKIKVKQLHDYIFDNQMPYWIIYRNSFFDTFADSLELNVFSFFRDRQLTTKNTTKENEAIRVLKSRNISDDGQRVINIKGYDEYISTEEVENKLVYSYLNKENVYLTPNMTYKTRLMAKPNGCLVNGSVAILIPKRNIMLSKEDLLFFSSDNYREYMQIARNYQTRTLNIDSTSIFFYGIKKAKAIEK